jgi:hypothetical protein
VVDEHEEQIEGVKSNGKELADDDAQSNARADARAKIRNNEYNDQYVPDAGDEPADNIEPRKPSVEDNDQYDVNPDAAPGHNVQDNDQYEGRADYHEDKIVAPGQYRPQAPDDENDGVEPRAGDQDIVASRHAREYDVEDVGQNAFELPARDPHSVAQGRAQEGFIGFQDAPYHEDKALGGRSGHDDLKGKVDGKLQVDLQDEVVPGQGDEIAAALDGRGGKVEQENERFDLNEIVREADEMSKEDARKKGERDIEGVTQDEVDGDGQQREAGPAEAIQDDDQLGGDVANARDDVEPPIGDRRQIGAEYHSHENPDEVKYDEPIERRRHRLADGDYEPVIDQILTEYREEGARRGVHESVGVGPDEPVPKPVYKRQQDEEELKDIIGPGDEPPQNEEEQREIAQPYHKPPPQDEQQQEESEVENVAPNDKQQQKEHEGEQVAEDYKQQQEEDEGEQVAADHRQQREDDEGEQLVADHKQQQEEYEGEQLAAGYTPKQEYNEGEQVAADYEQQREYDEGEQMAGVHKQQREEDNDEIAVPGFKQPEENQGDLVAAGYKQEQDEEPHERVQPGHDQPLEGEEPPDLGDPDYERRQHEAEENNILHPRYDDQPDAEAEEQTELAEPDYRQQQEQNEVLEAAHERLQDPEEPGVDQQEDEQDEGPGPGYKLRQDEEQNEIAQPFDDQQPEHNELAEPGDDQKSGPDEGSEIGEPGQEEEIWSPTMEVGDPFPDDENNMGPEAVVVILSVSPISCDDQCDVAIRYLPENVRVTHCKFGDIIARGRMRPDHMLHCKAPRHAPGEVNLTISKDGVRFVGNAIFIFEEKRVVSWGIIVPPIVIIASFTGFIWLKTRKQNRRRRDDDVLAPLAKQEVRPKPPLANRRHPPAFV